MSDYTKKVGYAVGYEGPREVEEEAPGWRPVTDYTIRDFLYANQGVEYLTSDSTAKIQDPLDIISIWNPYKAVRAQFTITTFKEYRQTGNWVGQKTIETNEKSETITLEPESTVRNYTVGEQKSVKHTFSSSMYQGWILKDTADLKTYYHIHLDAVWVRTGDDTSDKKIFGGGGGEDDERGNYYSVEYDNWYDKELIFTDFFQWLEEHIDDVLLVILGGVVLLIIGMAVSK